MHINLNKVIKPVVESNARFAFVSLPFSESNSYPNCQLQKIIATIFIQISGSIH